jgi:hypothetical protein
MICRMSFSGGLLRFMRLSASRVPVLASCRLLEKAMTCVEQIAPRCSRKQKGRGLSPAMAEVGGQVMV